MLTNDQRILLEHVIESLDRLFDRVSTAADVYSLLFATSIALRGTDLALSFDGPLRQLSVGVGSKAPLDEKRTTALDATDALRKLIADRLSQDAAENPKQRHARGHVSSAMTGDRGARG